MRSDPPPMMTLVVSYVRGFGARRVCGRRIAEVLRAALVVALVTTCDHSAFADDGATSAYRAALKRLAKRERVFWDQFAKRQAAAREVARTLWREMVRSMTELCATTFCISRSSSRRR